MTETGEMITGFIIGYYRKNRFYPSYDEIAEGTGRVKSTIHTHMAKLEGEGIIIRKNDCSPHYRLINMDFIMKHSMDHRQEELTSGKKTGSRRAAP